MNHFSRITLLATIFLALVFVPVFFFVTRGEVDAASFCFNKNSAGQCHYNFPFGATSQTKSVGKIYLNEAQQPQTGRWWPLQNLGGGGSRYCNGGVCVRDFNLPRLEMKKRSTDNDADDSIKIHLALYGETGEYWYTRKNEGYDAGDTTGLSAEEKKTAQGFSNLPSGAGYCRGEPTDGWQSGLDVKTSGIGGSPATKNDSSECYDASKVIVRRGANEQVARSNWNDSNSTIWYRNFAWDGYAVDAANNNRDDDCVTGSDKGYTDLSYKLSKCDENGFSRNTRSDFPQCSCDASPYALDQGCNTVIRGPAGDRYIHRTCYDQYEVNSTRTVWNPNTPIYGWRYRKVIKVPAFSSLQQLDKKSLGYAPYNSELGEERRYNDYLLYYDTQHPSSEKAATIKVPAVKTQSDPAIDQRNLCLLGGYISDIVKNSDHTEYILRARGNATNIFRAWSFLSDSQRGQVKSALIQHLGYSSATVNGWDGNQISQELRKINDGTTQYNKLREVLVSGSVLTSDQFSPLMGAARSVSGVATDSGVKDEGVACRIIIPSGLGINSTYVYFTGAASVPAVVINSFGVRASDSSLGTLTTVGISSSEIKDRVVMEGVWKGRVIQSISADKTVPIETVQEKTDLLLEWNTAFASNIELYQKDDRHQSGMSLDNVSGAQSLGAFQSDKASGEIIVRNLFLGKKYSFFLVARNTRGEGTSTVDTSWMKAARLDVEVKDPPVDIVASAKHLTGKPKCKPNITGNQTPTECAEITWNVSGKPSNVVIKYPKQGNGLLLTTDHQKTDGRYETGASQGSAKSAEINRNGTKFIIEAYRGDKLKDSETINFKAEPKTLLDTIADGWKDGNNLKNTSLVELLGLGDCEAVSNPVLGFLCSSFSIGSIITIVKFALNGVITGLTAGSPLGILADVLISVIEPIIFGLIGAIGNVLQAKNAGLINDDPGDSSPVWAGFFPRIASLYIGKIVADKVSFLGPIASTLITTGVGLLLDTAGSFLSKIGIPIFCHGYPEGTDQRNKCEMGEDVANSVVGLIDVIDKHTKPPEKKEIEAPGVGFKCVGEGKNKRCEAVPKDKAIYQDIVACKLACVDLIVPEPGVPKPEVKPSPPTITLPWCNDKKPPQLTDVGEGSPISNDYKNEPGWYTGADFVVGNVLMTSYYVASCGNACLPKENARRCAAKLRGIDKVKYDKAFEFSKTKNFDLSQQIKSFTYETAVILRDGFLKCGVDLIPYPCATVK